MPFLKKAKKKTKECHYERSNNKAFHFLHIMLDVLVVIYAILCLVKKKCRKLFKIKKKLILGVCCKCYWCSLLHFTWLLIIFGIWLLKSDLYTKINCTLMQHTLYKTLYIALWLCYSARKKSVSKYWNWALLYCKIS